MRFHWLRKDLNMFDTTTRHLTSSHIIIFLTFAVDIKYLILTLCAVFTLTLAFSPNASGIARSHKQAGAELRLFSLENQNDDENSQFSRRSMMRTAVQSASIITLTTLGASEPSYAGLIQFPCNRAMKNTYHVMRAGESLLESQDLLSTNPMLMTNRDDALSPLGEEQVFSAMDEMIMKDLNPSVVKYSLAAKCMDTANLVSDVMQVGRNRLIPEYTFMDPRGLGAWNMHPLSETEEAIWAMDEDEAGREGRGGCPPANDDGTAHETLSEQVIRLRQLMSVLETQFSGDEVLLIFGEGTSPALLSALIAGIPLNQVHELNFRPGEIRFDVTKDRVLSTLPVQPSEEYKSIIDRGRNTLKELREEALRPVIQDLPSTRPVTSVQESTKIYGPTLPRSITNPFKPPKRNTLPSPKHAAIVNDTPKIKSVQHFQPDFGSVPLFALGTAATVACSLSGQKEDEIVEREEKKTIVVQSANSTSAQNDVEIIVENEGKHTLEAQSSSTNSIAAPLLSPELQKMEDLAVSAPFVIPEMEVQVSKEEKIEDAADIPEMEVQVSKEDKIVNAADAMEEYMNRDDGGEDWLAQMASIANED